MQHITDMIVTGVIDFNVISVIRARDLGLPQQAAFDGIYIQVTQFRCYV